MQQMRNKPKINFKFQQQTLILVNSVERNHNYVIQEIFQYA